MIVIKSVHQIQDQAGLLQRRRIGQERVHFITGECAPQQLCDPIRNKTIATVQHRDRTQQGQFSSQGGALLARSVPGIQNDQFVASEERNNIRWMRVFPLRNNKQPPSGYQTGVIWGY